MSGPYGPVDMLARLVAYDTTSHKTNLPLLAFVRDYLAGHGVESRLITAPEGDKANLFATIGPQGERGIGLSGHTDVVPVTGQAWDSDPFEMRERDGALFGRGTADMKGFLACVLAAVPGFKAQALKTPIHILFSYDEEVGCTGVRPMIERLGKDLPRPRIVIVGEPTNMSVVDAHKGPSRYEVEISGRSAHSSMAHLGANPVMAAGKLIAWICRLEDQLTEGPRNERFSPPHSSIQVNLIEGGYAQNVIPATCKFGIDLRALPGSSAADIIGQLREFADKSVLPGLKAVAPEAEIAITLTNQVPAFEAPASSEATSLALQLAAQNETVAVSYATEAGLFELGGSSAVICGPGDIAQAHTANEYVNVDQLDKCMVFLERLAAWAADCPPAS